MYHHHHQQQQQPGSQPFPAGPPPNQAPVRAPADMMPPPVGSFQFPRPTQLPDELESALSIRGSRDMDHRLIEHLDRLSRHQNQVPAPAMGQHGNYGTNAQPKQQTVDWSSYEPPTKLFANPPLSAAHTGTSLPNWNPPTGDSPAPTPRGPMGRSFYTPESAGTILASFGLSNEDLEALSHYPDDQLTPDTLPFILRDLQVHKTGKPKPAPSRSPEVPSLLTVTQTEGRVIDYGHASQAKDESVSQKPFKKEPISSERTVKMYPSPVPKLEPSVGRQVRLEPTEPIKHGDRDYRRRSSEHHTSRSPPPPPPRDFSAKPRHQDRDYRPEPPKQRASAEKRSAEPPVPKPRPAPKPVRPTIKAAGAKKLPTPTMINDFSGVAPKVYPHTCSLCDMQCDLEKDWVEHLETVNHTAACRHLRTKYPNWKPKGPSREYGGRTVDHKRQSAGHLRSTSWSPPHQSPPDKPRGLAYKPRGKAYAQHHVPRHHPYHSKDVDAHFDRHSQDGSHLRRPTMRQPWEKREHPDGSSRMFMKRPHYDTKRLKGDSNKKPVTKYKSNLKPDTGKHAEDGPPAKKKKSIPPPAFRDPGCLVYLTDIPKEATELEVINLAGSFGPINNVLLMPLPDEEEAKDQCQQASVCMMTPGDAQTFANAPNLLIRDRVITATVAKSPEDEQSSDANGSSKPENDGADQVPEKKGVVLIEDLPENDWTEDDLKALAEPFGYPDDVIVAKQINKALLLFSDRFAAAEMAKVHAFSPLTVNGQKVNIKHFIKHLSMNTPVALYNSFMQPVKPVAWGLLIAVSNVPQTPAAASVAHKLVSRIGAVFRSLTVRDLVICEMANILLSAEVYKHYRKFPCMIQNSPLTFSRKIDHKPLHLSSPVIPAFLDTEKDVSEIKKEPDTTPAIAKNEKPQDQDEPPQDAEVKSEQTEAEVTETEAKEETHETTEPVTDAAQQTELKPEEIKTEPTEQLSAEAATDETTTEPTVATAKENGPKVQPPEDSKTVTLTEEEAAAQETNTDVRDPKVVASEQKTTVKPAKKPPAPAKKQQSTERSKEPSKNNNSSSSREDERRRTERERRERESRDKDKRDRVRKEREHEERSKREHERERRGDVKREDRREEMKREWRREWERREGRRKPFEESNRRRDDRRSHHRDDKHRSSSKKSTTEEEEDDFPFNLSDFVTVDEVGDVDNEELNRDAPSETGPEPGQKTETRTKETKAEATEEEPQSVPETEPAPEQPQEANQVTLTEVNPEEPEMENIQTDLKTEKPELSPDPESTVADEVKGEEQSAAGDVSDVTEAPCPAAAVEEDKKEEAEEEREETCETIQEESEPPQDGTPEAQTSAENEENMEEAKEEALAEEKHEAAAAEKQDTDMETESAPPAAESEKSENGEKDDVSENAQRNDTNNSLPPFDPNNSVGLEYLVPMTGFFCKVCSRFFTGAKDTQISHSKSLKHYENLEKFLKRQSSAAASSS